MVAKVAKQEIALNLPRRPTTVERYLKIVKFALGRDRDVEAVAKHFGCSPGDGAQCHPRVRGDL
jgi:hypothetical protein